MVNLCKYKNSLGKPNEGFHKKRIPIINLALNDVIGTIILGIILWIILKLFNKNTIFTKYIYIQLLICILLMFLLGILSHLLFCVNTTLNKFIFRT